MVNTKTAIKVDSYVQAKFHLYNGEVLVHPINWFKSIFAHKTNKDLIQITIVNRFGISSVFEGDFKALENMMAEYNFYVFKGSKLSEVKNPSVLQKSIGNLTKLFSRGDK